MLNSVAFLIGLLPDAIRAVHEVVRAVRAGDKSKAIRAAYRAASIQAFHANRRKLDEKD